MAKEAEAVAVMAVTTDLESRQVSDVMAAAVTSDVVHEQGVMCRAMPGVGGVTGPATRGRVVQPPVMLVREAVAGRARPLHR